MKERPILFSGPMVRAILEDRKTQTRRVVKPQPLWEEEPGQNAEDEWCGRYQTLDGAEVDVRRCPYGQPGDRLWVRESWRDAGNGRFLYAATPPELQPKSGLRWKPSIHMPRRACRIILEVTGVRVERLQEISEEDAKSEGVEYLYSDDDIKFRPEFWEAERSYRNYLWHGNFGQYGMGNKKSDNWPHQYSNYKKARGSFSSLWASINGPESWDANPWVWVVEFKRI